MLKKREKDYNSFHLFIKFNVTHYCKLNTFEVWTIGRTKQKYNDISM